MTALVVMLAAAGTWLILTAIKTVHVERHRRRAASSFLAHHQRTIRGNQVRREADESAPIVWRR